MQELKDVLSGIDKTNEIINLWYEVTFLRGVLVQLATKDQLGKLNLEFARNEAQEIVRERFPKLKITFSKVTEEELKRQ